MANEIALGKTYVPLLDEKYVAEAKTSILDANEELVRVAENGKDFYVPVINMDGLAQHTRGGEYVEGDVSLEWKLKYIEAFNKMEETLKQINVPSYQIEDKIARAKQWIVEEKERQQLKLENKQLKDEIDEYKDFKELREILEGNISDMRVGDFSKLLYNNGIKIGRNNLYRWLQVNKYICKVYGHFSPKQQYLDNGYLSRTPSASALISM